MPRSLRLRACALALATAALLAGCTASFPDRAEPAKTTTARAVRPTSAATPRPTPTLDALIRSEGHITGSGTLTGAITGTVQLRPEGSGYLTASFQHLAFGTSRNRSIVLGTSVHALGCNDDGVSVVMPDAELGSGATQEVTGLVGGNEYADFSNFTALAITSGGCDDGSTPIAVARLHWDVPRSLSRLPVTDHGARYGARGPVSMSASGRPSSYRVVSNDLLGDVAARFGITPDELLWLNPFREHGDDGLLDVDEVLNLDPAERG